MKFFSKICVFCVLFCMFFFLTCNDDILLDENAYDIDTERVPTPAPTVTPGPTSPPTDAPEPTEQCQSKGEIETDVTYTITGEGTEEYVYYYYDCDDQQNEKYKKILEILQDMFGSNIPDLCKGECEGTDICYPAHLSRTGGSGAFFYYTHNPPENCYIRVKAEAGQSLKLKAQCDCKAPTETPSPTPTQEPTIVPTATP